MVFDEVSEEWLKIGSKRNRHATSDCKLLLFLLQQFAFPRGAPAVTAEPAALLHYAMAGDDETDVIGRTGAGNRANGRGRANRSCDVAVRARLAVGDRLKVPPDPPLKRRRFHIERQIELRRPAVQMRDKRMYPLRERTSFTLNGGGRILGTQTKRL